MDTHDALSKIRIVRGQIAVLEKIIIDLSSHLMEMQEIIVDDNEKYVELFKLKF